MDNGHWTIIKTGNLEYFTANNLSVPHAFTTRLGGVSEGFLSSLNLGMHRGDTCENVQKNYEILADSLGFPTQKLVLSHQIHTDIVRVVTEKDCLGSLSHRDYPQCDALVTNTAGVALTVFSADCTPIVFHDPVTGAVGAAHAGWRGTALGIAAKTVETMVADFGCKRENIRAAIGPNIGVCCFETHRDVADAMTTALGKDAKAYIHPTREKFHIDLKGLNALWLRRSGVTDITISTECTACSPDRFWSHRIVGEKRGSQGAIIVCKEGNR